MNSSTAWPKPLAPAALHGLVGKIIRAVEPHTEADPAALLGQFLVALGSVIGRNAHFQVEATRHYLNLFLALVGETAKARKGTSWDRISHLHREAESLLLQAEGSGNAAQLHGALKWGERYVTGLSSGEGLIWEVRDPIETAKEPDPGVSDKRRIVVDAEFASTLKMLGRQGNTLSAVIRNAWDSGDLRILTKNSPARSTGAHISIIGHITQDELRRELTATEQGNGFANRFLWCCARRSKLLPDGGQLCDFEVAPLVEELSDVVTVARVTEEMKRDEDARRLWHEIYSDLSEGEPGLLGAVIARAEAQVMRLACLYALLDMSNVVRVEHLQAGLAVWDYCEQSARFIFGEATGHSVADEILWKLRTSPGGLTRTNIRDLFHRNSTQPKIDEALSYLEEHALAYSERDTTHGGRPAERWFAVDTTERQNAA